jgi:hypothetical protein
MLKPTGRAIPPIGRETLYFEPFQKLGVGWRRAQRRSTTPFGFWWVFVGLDRTLQVFG